MLKISNTPKITQRNKAGVIRGVVFSFTFIVSTIVGSSIEIDGPISVIDGKTTIKPLPLGHIGLDTTVSVLGTIGVGTLSNHQSGRVRVHIPIEEIEDAIISHCSSDVHTLLTCADLYFYNK